jgi:hypothetical protein
MFIADLFENDDDLFSQKDTTVGKYWRGDNTHYQDVWNQLVPASGPAPTLEGELLRSASRLYYDWYNNGFGNNTSGAANFLAQNCNGGLPLLTALRTINPYIRGNNQFADDDSKNIERSLEIIMDTVMAQITRAGGRYQPNTVGDLFDLDDPNDSWADEDDWEEEEYDEEDLDEADDDLFSDRSTLDTPKTIATGVDYAVDGWLDRAHDPVNHRRIEIGYEGTKVVTEFLKGMVPGLRAWYQLDNELRDDIAASIKDDVDIDLYALYDSLPPINEESDDDLFADSDRVATYAAIKKFEEYGDMILPKLDEFAAAYNHEYPELDQGPLAQWRDRDDYDNIFSYIVNGIGTNFDMLYAFENVIREFGPAAITEIDYVWHDNDFQEYYTGWENFKRQTDKSAFLDDIRGFARALKRHGRIFEESDDDLFADRTDVSDIVDAIDEVADHWGHLGPSVKEDDPDWYHYANMLHDAAVEFKLHGVMQGMRALARIDVWEPLADTLEFLGFDEVWEKIEQYIDSLNEAVDNEDETELSADERETNLKKFLEPSHPDVQQRLYRGQRRAPKPNQFVLQKGRDTPSFTDDPEVANVYSRQLDIGHPEHGPGSTSVPVYLQMSRPLDIRGLGEYFSLLDFVAVLPRVDLAQESVPNGLGWYDLSYMVADLDELIYRTGAKSEIEASGSDSLSTIRDFEELAQEIAVSGEEGDLGQIEYMLSETQLDSFIIADSTDIVNRLEKMGYDGVILSDIFTAGAPYYQGDVDKLQTGAWDDEDRVVTAYRPFDQGKIKSAIGNRGTYNTADPDITRESRSTKYSK